MVADLCVSSPLLVVLNKRKVHLEYQVDNGILYLVGSDVCSSGVQPPSTSQDFHRPLDSHDAGFIYMY